MLPPLSALRVDCCIGKRRAVAATGAAWFADLDANNDANPEYSWEALMEENDPITLTPLKKALDDDLDDPPTIISPSGTLMRRSSYEALLASGSEFDPITRAPLYPAEGDFRGTAMVAVIETDEATGEKRFKRARTVNENGKTIERIVFEPYRPPPPSEPEYIERLLSPTLKLHYETRRRLGELLEAWYSEAAKLMCANDEDRRLQSAFPSETLAELFRQLVPRSFPKSVAKAIDVDNFETPSSTMMVRRTHMTHAVEESLRFLAEMFTNCTEAVKPIDVPKEPWSRRDPRRRRVLDPVTAFGKAVYVTEYSIDRCFHLFYVACSGLVYIKAVHLSQAERMGSDAKSAVWQALHVAAALVALAKAMSFSMHYALLQDYAATYANAPPAVFDVSSEDSAASKLLHDLCTWEPSDDVRNSPGSTHPWIDHRNAFLRPLQRFRDLEEATKRLENDPARRRVLTPRARLAEALVRNLAARLADLGGFLKSYYTSREALLKLEKLYTGMFRTTRSLRENEQLPSPRRAAYLDWGMKSEDYANDWRAYYRNFGVLSVAAWSKFFMPESAFSTHEIVSAAWNRIIEATEIIMDLTLCHRDCIDVKISNPPDDVFETPTSPHPFAWRWRFYDESSAIITHLQADYQIVNPGERKEVEGFARRAESVAARAARKLFEMQNVHNIERTSPNESAKKEARRRHEDFGILIQFAHEVISCHLLFDQRKEALNKLQRGDVRDENNTLEDILVAHFLRAFQSLEDTLKTSRLHSKEAANFLLYLVNQVQSAHARLVRRVKRLAVMEAVNMSGGASGPAAPVLQRLASELRERNLWELLEEPSVKEETMALIAGDAERRIARFARQCNIIKSSINGE